MFEINVDPINITDDGMASFDVKILSQNNCKIYD